MNLKDPYNISAQEIIRHSESKDEVIAELTLQNGMMLDVLKEIREQPHYSMIDGRMNGWAREAIKEYYRIEREYLTKKRLDRDEEGYPIGSYTGKLEQENNRLQKENETLSAALDDARKEIRVLKNKLERSP